MEKLTRNTHGYEFQLMENVIVQYNAYMMGSMPIIGESTVQIFGDGLTVTKLVEISDKLTEYYSDEISVYPAIEEHFKSIN